MKACAYCGRENDDEATHCRECGTPEFKGAKTEAPKAEPQTELSTLTRQEFVPVPSSDMQNDLVVLMKCRTLVEAEMTVSLLESAGIYSFIPDQSLMQTVSWNLNTYGYVRVQVSPKDYAAAKEFLLASP